MQILIPISGHSVFFPKEEFYFPKPLIEVAGSPMIELVIRPLKQQFKNAHLIFVVDRDDTISFNLENTLSLLSGDDLHIVEKPGKTSGPLCSCLLAIDALDLDQPLIISSSDQIIDYDLSQIVDDFSSKQASAGVITFESVHPRWSYIIDDGAGNVVQSFSNKVASRHAIAGLFYFKTARLFTDAAMQVILNDAQIDGTYSIVATLNEIILKGESVLCVPIESSRYHSFYSPAKIDEFERTHYAAQLREGMHSTRRVNVIIPAAGEGRRFSNAGWKKPKPFIDVEGKPMLHHVIGNICPKGGQVTLLLRQQHINSNSDIVSSLRQNNYNIISVPKLTEGTASTVLLSRDIFNNEDSMMVANSDQLVDFDVNAYIDDCFDRCLDGSILVFRDPMMDPKWSFVKLNNAGLVVEVAEKNPISDLATVGVYFFKKGTDFVSAALDMILANDRVNNEFYTCPVYNYMIRNGARIGVFEVPFDAMSGLGTPEDLNLFLAKRGSSASCDRPI